MTKMSKETEIYDYIVVGMYDVRDGRVTPEQFAQNVAERWAQEVRDAREKFDPDYLEGCGGDCDCGES